MVGNSEEVENAKEIDIYIWKVRCEIRASIDYFKDLVRVCCATC
jgi:hypothetical protein